MTTLDLTWFELGVRAEIPDGGRLLPFLSAYFEPAIRLLPPSSAVDAIATLRVEVGPAPPEAPARGAGEPVVVDRSGGFLRCDGRIVERDGARWIWLSPSGALLRRAGTELTLWAPDEDAARVPVIRIVEDLILDEAQRRGAIVLHASAVVVNGRAVLFCGNKGAGKTTALLRALEITDGGLLANDNVCLVARGEHYQARAWPAFLKAEAGTVASTGPLARDLPDTHRRWLGDDAALWDIYEKVALYPAQAAVRFDARAVAEAVVGTLILPQFAPDRPPAVAPAVQADVERLLPELLQGVFNPNHGPWLQPLVDPALVYRSLAGFTTWLRRADVPIYTLSWAPSLSDLLLRVADLRAGRKLPAASTDDWPPLPQAGPPTLTFKARRGGPGPGGGTTAGR